MTEKRLKTHSRNLLYSLLKLSLLIRTKAHGFRGIRKTGLYALAYSIDLAGYSYTLFTGTLPRFRWFSRFSAAAANRVRDALVGKLHGRIQVTAGDSKLYTGNLSPGCLHCIEGDWACNFINRLCNRDCFFCKRSHSLLREEPEPETWGFFFPDTGSHLDYIKTFHIKGVSFSGGEPLLVKDRLLQHLEAVHGRFGDSVYIWMYTNGDLVNQEILEELNKAGLDEIRFNIAARDYDLSPVILARQHIKTVTVEIPCIPEDHEKLKSLLLEMEKTGVDFLNIHQLSVEEQNCRELVRRRYHFTGNYPGISVYESELCALKLLLYALDQEIRLPINYCSSIYKQRYQGRGFRKQRASAFPGPYEELTETGHLRRISLTSSPEQLLREDKKLRAEGINPELWSLAENGESMAIHSSLLSGINWSETEAAITYLKPGVAPKEAGGKREAGKLKPDNSVVFRARGLKLPDLELWKKLYLEGAGLNSALEDHLDTRSKPQPDREALDSILKMAEFEIQDRGFPDII